ncbi:hypothetical protein SCLCIDRAFT_1224514 [Scleroderma citrinum Foug A]|uniref:Uncharacterized protein n=1 Tax=Scleroderma citrinum Foug A TaxID=1036808 RepID=A0A0C2ZF03_9AGAM|nr:hypothetical protein SCLCIDRAFT_1224514 [Scleroderma citrinum Foug A]
MSYLYDVWLFPASPQVLKLPIITQLYFRAFELTGTFRSSSSPNRSPDRLGVVES